MSRRMTTVCVLALVGLFAVSVGCSGKPSRIHAPSISASSAGSEAIEMFDIDKDGKLSGEELIKCPGLKAAVIRIDTDGDGAITAEEITARIKAWQDSKLGRSVFMCKVTRNGMPLVGADVKLVPEKYLGENVQVAEGKTDKSGMAMINIPNMTPPGIAPGLYRVEITKAGENIPAQYNVNTILGQEIAHDSQEMMQGGVVFNLQY